MSGVYCQQVAGLRLQEFGYLEWGQLKCFDLVGTRILFVLLKIFPEKHFLHFCCLFDTKNWSKVKCFLGQRKTKGEFKKNI